MGDTLGYAVSVLGLSPLYFYELTPAEFNYVMKVYNEYKIQEYNILGGVIYNAVGLAFAGKPYKSIFDNKTVNKQQTKKISKEEVNELLDYMSKKFKL